MENDDGRDDATLLAEELFERCAPIVELDGPQIEGFVSGLFAAWDGDQQGTAFVELCRRTGGRRAATVCAALAVLDTGPVGLQARAVADRMASLIVDGGRSLGASRPVQAWRVDAPFGTSIVVGCRASGEHVDHAVLAELDGDRLVDLQLSGSPAELLDGASNIDGAMRVEDLEVGAALDEISEAWLAAHDRVEPTPGMLANQRFVRLRLSGAREGAALPLFRSGAVVVDLSRGMTDAERADADRAASSTLVAALGEPPPDGFVHEAWREIVQGSVPGLSMREREALLWLEWADWLGVGIGLARRTDEDREMTGELMVDLVNRCPEVSSTIDRNDRDYAAWAFEVALDHLRDAGLVVDDALTDEGRRSVHASLAAAWAG